MTAEEDGGAVECGLDAGNDGGGGLTATRTLSYEATSRVPDRGGGDDADGGRGARSGGGCVRY